MAELIDKNKLIDYIKMWDIGNGINHGQKDFIEAVVNQPTTTEAEIRNRAIEEFIDRLKKHEHENWIDYHEYGITWSDIELIERQMKGEVNETD